jgi:uncharacterized protein (DUF1697 family)
MTTCIALLRGINVGGNCPLPMKELVAIMQELGATKVRTYIQSGNVVFESADANPSKLGPRLSAEIGKRRGFEPRVLIMEVAALKKAMARNPFPEAESEGSTLHLGFLASRPTKPDLDKIEKLRKETEKFRLDGQVFYLHAPEGVGRSRLAASAEKLLGAPMTDRNWRTVCKLVEMGED